MESKWTQHRIVMIALNDRRTFDLIIFKLNREN